MSSRDDVVLVAVPRLILKSACNIDYNRQTTTNQSYPQAYRHGAKCFCRVRSDCGVNWQFGVGLIGWGGLVVLSAGAAELHSCCRRVRGRGKRKLSEFLEFHQQISTTNGANLKGERNIQRTACGF
jgi:hypothetical protein